MNRIPQSFDLVASLRKQIQLQGQAPDLENRISQNVAGGHLIQGVRGRSFAYQWWYPGIMQIQGPRVDRLKPDGWAASSTSTFSRPSMASLALSYDKGRSLAGRTRHFSVNMCQTWLPRM